MWKAKEKFVFPRQTTITKLLADILRWSSKSLSLAHLLTPKQERQEKSLNLIVTTSQRLWVCDLYAFFHTRSITLEQKPASLFPENTHMHARQDWYNRGETSGTITIKCSKHLRALSLWVSWTWTDPHHSHHWSTHRGLILDMTASVWCRFYAVHLFLSGSITY